MAHGTVQVVNLDGGGTLVAMGEVIFENDVLQDRFVMQGALLLPEIHLAADLGSGSSMRVRTPRRSARAFPQYRSADLTAKQ